MYLTQKLLKISIIISTVVFIAGFIIIAFLRISYPFELELMEGGSVIQLDMMMHGKSMYISPTIEYMPQIYTPFYYMAAVPFAKIFGINLFSLRLVSVLSTLGCLIILFFFVKRETKNNYFGLICAGAFAGSFGIGGAWFDLARVDMLFVFLYLLSIFILRGVLIRDKNNSVIKYKDSLLLIISAFFAFLSFFTKQSAIMLFFPISLYLLVFEWKRGWFFNIPFYFLAAISTIYYSLETNGWYYFWNFTLPADHRWTPKVYILFWTYDLIKPMGIAMVFTAFYFLLTKFKDNKREILLFGSIITGAIICSYTSRLHYGGYLNVMIPIYTILCIFFALGLYKIPFSNPFTNKRKNEVISTEDNFKVEFSSKVSLSGPNFSFLILILAFFQFIMLIYSPERAFPGKEDVKAGWELVNKIKSYKGDVWVAGHQYYAFLSGKRVYTHGILIWDMIQSKTKYNKLIENEILTALENHKFDAIISYTNMEYNYPPFLKYYQADTKATERDDVLWTKTGTATRPDMIYIPR